MAGHPIFAALYDRLVASIERDGLQEMRAELLAKASGRTLELGAGTGHNLPHYRDSVTELALTEPDPHMAKRLRRNLAEDGLEIPAEVIEAPAEELPFEAESFDTVVSTLVLCTVSDPARASAEITRVLRPDGRLLYLEHVRDVPGSRRARWQDRLERPWGWFGAGCHPNRDTGATLEAAGLDTSEQRSGSLPDSAGPLVKPVITGAARARAGP